MPDTPDLDPDLEPLLRSPKLPAYIQKLEHALAEEQRVRQQFYESHSSTDQAEFINGLIVPAPAHSPQHNEATASLIALLRTYAQAQGLGTVTGQPVLVSLTRNDYQPDVCFWPQAQASTFQPGQSRFPAPTFVAEVLSPASAHIDRGIKLEDYAMHTIPEYWILDPERQSVEQYVLDGDHYTLAVKTDDGALKSQAIPGFVISTRAIFDPAQLAHALQTLAT